MDAETKSRVHDHAGSRCEYCRIHQQRYIITFHVEHNVVQQHHGGNDESNLALACHFCNRHKGPNLAGIDSTTGELTRLFNPRTDTWNQHFRIQAGRVIRSHARGQDNRLCAQHEPPRSHTDRA